MSEETVQEEPQELDMTTPEPTPEPEIDKVRQQIQQEVGNKTRPIMERLEELAAKLDKSATPAENDTQLAPDDYMTVAEARQMLKDEQSNIIGKLEQVQMQNQDLASRNRFQNKFPGLDYDDVTEDAFKLAREDNPGVSDEHLGGVAASYMNRLGRQSKTVAPKSTPKQDKKAPVSTKGASVTTNASVSPGESMAPDADLSLDEINDKYGF